MKRLAAVVLSAGYSSRMEQFKPLLSIGGRTLIDRTISIFTPADVDVFIVVGWQKEKILNLNLDEARIVDNPDYAKGMLTSIQAGVRQLGNDYQGFFVLPVDIPLVRPFTVRCLIEEFKKQPDKILYPVFNHKRGHPPLIPVSLADEILNCPGDGGLQAVLEKHPGLSVEIPVPDSYILFDLDTYRDYESALEKFTTYDIPSEEEYAAIYDFCKTDPNRRRHCRKVAEIADLLGKALSDSGHPVNFPVIRAAALLHDIVRDQPKHDETGGRLLKEMGFPLVGDIVGVHTFLQKEVPGYHLESRIVYLADKFAQGDTLVSLETRFQASMHRFGDKPEVQEMIRQRRHKAQSVKNELETLLGYPLESVISTES